MADRNIDIVIRAKDVQTKPIQDLLETVNKLTASLDKLEKTGAGKSLDGLTQQAKQFQAVADEIGRRKALIEQLQTTATAVERTTAAFHTAQAELAAYKTSIASVEKLSRDQRDTLKSLEKSVRDAGSAATRATSSYAKQEEALGRLGTSATNASSHLKALAQAADQVDKAAVRVETGVGRASRAFKQFEDGGRTTLSITQRIRGEFLSLAASVGGLFALLRAGQGAFDAAVGKEQTIARLQLVTGSLDEATNLYGRLVKRAEETGVPFEPAVKGFSSLAISAKEGGLALQDIETLYGKIIKASSVLGLSQDDLQGVLLATAQSFNKDKVGSEELVQQLGERLPGVVPLLAKALGTTTDRLAEFIQKNKLSPRVLIDLFDGIVVNAEKAGVSIGKASQASANFQNAVSRLKQALADSGFLKALTDLMNEFADTVKRGDFNLAIKNLGDLLGFAANTAKFLLTNMELVYAALALVTGAAIFRGLGQLDALLKALTVSGGAASAAISGIARVIAAFAVGYYVGKWIDDNLIQPFGKVREVITTVVGGVVELFGALQDFFSAGTWGEFMSRIEVRLARFRDQLAITRAEFSTPAEGGGKEGWAQSMGIADPKEVAKQGAEANKAYSAAKEFQLAIQKAADDKLKRMESNTLRDMAKARKDFRRDALLEFAEVQNAINEIQDPKEKQSRQDQFNKFIDQQVKVKQDADRSSQVQARRDAKVDEKFALQDAQETLDRLKKKLAEQQDELDRAHQRGLISIQQYYAASGELQELALEGERQKLRAQKSVLEKSQDPDAKRKLIMLEGDLKDIEVQRARNWETIAFKIEQATEALRQQFDDVENNVREALGDSYGAALDRIETRYNDLMLRAKGLTDEDRARAELAALQERNLARQSALLDDMRRKSDAQRTLDQAKLNAGVATGQMTPLQTAVAQTAINQQQVADIQAQLAQMSALGLQGTEAFKQLQAKLIEVGSTADVVARQVQDVFQTAADAAVDTLFKTGSVGEGLKAMAKSILGSIKDTFAKELSNTLAKSLQEALFGDTLKSLFSSLGKGLFGGGGLLGGLFGGGGGVPAWDAGMMHSGGVVGPGMPRRAALPQWFYNAPRLHDGGVVGLKSDEMPTILRRGEEVITRQDPRHVLNAPPPSTLSVNLNDRSLNVTMRDWLERELARIAATQ